MSAEGSRVASAQGVVSDVVAFDVFLSMEDPGLTSSGEKTKTGGVKLMWKPHGSSKVLAALGLVVVSSAALADEQPIRDDTGKSTSTATLRRELSSLSRQGLEPAKLGMPAPDFSLPLLEESKVPDWVPVDPSNKRSLRLSKFQGKRPVVLIFGSYT